MIRLFTTLKMRVALLGICLLTTTAAMAQDYSAAAMTYFQNNAEKYGLARKDLSELIVTDVTPSEGGIQHIYLRQAVQGIGIYGAEMSVTYDAQGKVASEWIHGVRNAQAIINTTTPALTQRDAITAAAKHFGWPSPGNLEEMERLATPDQAVRFAGSGFSEEDIPVRLVFFKVEGSGGGQASQHLRLAWDFNVLRPKSNHWWSLKVDALTGEVLEQLDWTTHCKFHGGPVTFDQHAHEEARVSACLEAPAAPFLPPPPNSYNVFRDPVESPSHGVRSYATSPWNTTYSPYGWHDTNGSTGNEYTITRGNNVWAQEDANGNDGTGFSPDGGATLNFDFALNLNAAPSTYQSAAITNLFYWNNRIHDVWARYGFDAPSGNFQQNNYGMGGTGNDYVLADGQDGGGMDNANFATPAEGTRPRMQMYLWTGQATTNFLVNSPAPVAGSYFAVPAQFGPTLPVVPITQNLVLVSDGTGNPSLGCNALVNGGLLSGKIALIDRGTCTFVQKVQNAQNAGAVACVVCNNVAGSPITMGGTSGTITIPSVMISLDDCNILKAQLAQNVNVSLSSPGTAFNRDGDFDNVIIAHEYGHGISSRLTGGPSNPNCLNNAEQMGEGWSDWFGLMMTMEPGDVGTDVRGIGTYAVFQPTNGTGIRPAPYTTDMNINDFTYGDISNTTLISQPHGIGFLWCNMLWEMTWQLVNRYGWDPDIVNGTGGNNIAMRLVIQGLKLQPCSPGFVDGRNAILDADTMLYGGQYSCLIWEAFAKRGLGLSASQGSATSRSDGTEAFNTPPCAVSNFTAAPLTVCAGASVTFTDQSAGSPTGWSWNFGDGTPVSTQQNPTHVYSTPGTYNVSLTVTVGASSNTFTRNNYITVVAAPSATASITHAACGNSNGAITASASGGAGPYTYAWSNGGSTATISSLAPGTYTVTTTNAAGCIGTNSFTVNNQPGPTASISGTTPTGCGASTGTATASGTGGTGLLTYAWSNGGNTAAITGLAAGSYTVTVTDQNGCTSTAVATVSNSTGPSANISTTVHTSCGLNNGAATASASGGTGALTYLWSNGATTTSISNLAPGTYTVSVTDQMGCLAVTSVAINSSSAPTASILSQTDASCGQSNGTITADATGGTSGYTYLWSNGGTTATISSLGAGTFTVTVTDGAGCTSTASTTIQAFTQPVPNVVVTDLTCYNQNDGSLVSNPTGGNPPYTYQWSTGVLTNQLNGLAPGLYFVTVTDASGCNVTSFGVVNQPAELLATTSFTNESGPGANDGTATVSPSGGNPPYTYQWSSGGTAATETGLGAGTYTCTITDVNGCQITVTVDVSTAIGIGNALPDYEVGLWPNPNDGSFYLSIHLPNHQDVDLRLYNALGQIVEQRRLEDAYRTNIYFEGINLAAGVYQLQISSDQFRVTKKVIVAKQ
jgi:PKD repeat protein